MLHRRRSARNSFHGAFQQAILESFTTGRRRRLARQRNLRQQYAATEQLEIRSLLSGNPLSGGSSNTGDDPGEVHSHPVFAPGTSPEYVSSFNDNVGALGGVGSPGFTTTTRWTTTATNGGGLGQGDLTTLTWSIVPDGTAIPALGGIATESSAASDLVSYLGGIYGVTTNDLNFTDEPWFAPVKSVFDRWSILTGINYVYSAADDGAAFSNSLANPGVPGVRGDVRIGGHYIDGNSNVLAYNFFPNHGDMVIDTGDNFFQTTTNNSIRLRNTVAHEAGHGIGLSHVDSNNAAFLMEPFIDTSFDGPQLDDILAAQRLYGDNREANDSPASATSLGTLVVNQPFFIGTHGSSTVVAAGESQFISIDGASDSDYFSFTVGTAGPVTVTMTPKETVYNQGPQGQTQSPLNTAILNDLNVQLIGTDGTTVLASGVSSPTAPFKSLSFGVPSAGTYYAKVTGTVDAVQTYQLSVGLASAVVPALSLVISADSIVENGGTTTATIQRNTDTNAALAVNLSSNDTTEASVPATVTIPAGQASVIFTITGVDDNLNDGTQSVTITASSTGFVSGTDTLLVSDNETTGFIFSQTSGIVTGEESEFLINPQNLSTFVTVRLASQPTANVTITFTSSDVTEGTVGLSSLTFTPASWNTAQALPINGVDDFIDDGDIAYTIITNAATSTDSNYNGLNPVDLSVTNIDNENIGVSIIELSGTTAVTEGGVTDSYMVKLNAPPTANVTINIASNSSQITTSASSLVFTPANWNVFQTVTVTAVNDALPEGTQTASLTHSAASADTLYNGINISSVNVSITDNDIAGVSIVETAGTAVTEGGATDTYTVRLTAQPTANVTVNITGNSQVTTSAASLIFSPANWNVAQTVTVTAVNDLQSEGTQTVTLTHSSTSSDGLFNGLTIFSVGVTITDNDAAALSVTISPASLSENGGTAVGTVTRNTADISQPLTVNLTRNDATELSIPSTVVIPAGASSATFLVTGVDDTLLDGTQTVTVTASSGTAAGTLDSSFGVNGYATIPNYVQNLQPSFPEIVEQADGKYVVAGRHPTLPNSWNVIRLNRNGTLDATFGNNGITTTNFASEIQPQGIALYPDGQILIVGRGLSVSGHGIARYSSSGALNLQINPGGNIAAQDVVVDNVGDGGFLVGGSNSFAVDFAVTRYRANGTVDTSYGTAGTAVFVRTSTEETGWAMVQQPDRKVIVVGSSNGDFGIVRFNPNGTPDTGFNALNTPGLNTVNFGSFDSAQAVALAPDGKIVVAGNVNGNWGVTRITANGFLDTNFGTFGIINQDFSGLSEDAHTVGVQADGRIVVGGAAFVSGEGRNMALVRYTVNGALDTSFDFDGKLILPPQPSIFEATRALAMQADGNIIVLGGYNNEFVAFRVNTGVNVFVPGMATVQVTDDETVSLAVSAASISENGGTATGTVTRSNTDNGIALTVTLFNSDTTEVSIPATVTIPAGQASATFTITGVDDTVLDGTQIVTLSTAAAGYFGTASNLNVTDDESPKLTVVINATSISEAAGLEATTATITRNSDTTSALTVTLSSGDTSEVSVVTTVTIPAGQTSVTVPIDAVDDFIVDGTITVAVTASASGLVSGSSNVDVTDNDVAGITISPVSGLVTNEAGGIATFTAVLTSQPTASVSVSLTTSDASEGTVSASSLTFTSANWNVPQTVTVAGVDDLIVDGNIAFTIITGIATSSDPTYNGLNPADVTVTNTDNNVAQLSLTIAAGSISEGAGSTATTATVTRNTDTSAALTVTLSSNDTGEATVPATVTIPVGASSVTFAIAAIDDLIVDGTQSVLLTATVSGHADATAAVNVTDNDVLSLTLTISPTSISEAGGTATGTISRNDGDLSSPLTVNLSSNDASEATVPVSATIPAGQSSVTVPVAAVDDFIVDGTIAVTLIASAAGYVSAADGVDITDNDVAGIAISPVSGLVTTEAGGTATFSAVLTSQPEFAFSFSITSSDPTEGWVNFAALTFTPANWNIPQIVTVSGLDDSILDGDVAYTIVTGVAFGGDPVYTGMNPADVSVTNIDNDFAELTITFAEGAFSEAAGSSATIATLTRNTNTSGPLTVTLSSSDSSEATVPLTVVIPAGDSSVTFPVSAVDDLIVDGTQVVTISATAAGHAGGTQTLLVADNDIAGFSVVTPGVLIVNESGATQTFDVVLTAAPLTNVVITVSGNDLGEAVASPTTLTFTPSNWNVPQTVIVTGVDDFVADDAQVSILTVSINASASDDAFDTVTNQTATVLTLDNDVLTLSLTVSQTSLSEAAGTATATVSRNDGNLSLPLTVSLSSNDLTEAAVPTTVTIPAGQASVTFTVTGVDDVINDGAQIVSISATAPAFGYIGATTSLTVTDNDAAVISTNALTISEGATVVLGSANISTIDPEFTAAQLTYTASGISNGRFELGSAPGVAITNFTQAQINAGAVRFVHNGGEAAPAYSLTVSDGTRTSTASQATITFTNVNDAPVVSGGLGNVTVTQGTANQTISLTSAFSDVDNATLSYSAVSSNAALAGVSVSGSNLVLSFSATLTGSATVTVTATDAGGLSVSTTLTVTVNSIVAGPGVTLVNGVLTVAGTNGNDWVQVDRVGSLYRVKANFTSASGVFFNVSAVQSIVVNVLDGNDSVSISSSILIPVTLNGGNGNDDLVGGSGANTINGGAGNDEITGGSGSDVIDAGTGNDEVDAGNGNDVIYGGDGNDEIEAGDGNDTIYAGSGNDEIEGDAGNDSIFAGDGNDEIEGGSGNDLLFGEAGNDDLKGDDGNDILSGGSGNDELEGGNGRDLLIGGLGSDTLSASGDDDILFGNRVTFEDNVTALQLVLAEWTSSRSYNVRVANLKGKGSGTRLNGNTFLNSSTALNDTAIDSLFGSNGEDWFLGTVGQDLFRDRSGNELIN